MKEKCIGAVMSEKLTHEILGQMKYTLSKKTVDGRDGFCLSIKQVTPSGEVRYSEAEDVCCDYETACALFRALTEGEVEPCVLYDILYDMLP